MKIYTKPVILSEDILEKTTLTCDDYAYYTKAGVVCYDDFLGRGKINTACSSTTLLGFQP